MVRNGGFPWTGISIVSEGSKTEPNYFGEIRAEYRLHSANVAVQPSALGTQPIQVVEYARDLFENGNASKGIRPKAFEKVYAVFDRDDHPTFHNALLRWEWQLYRIRAADDPADPRHPPRPRTS